MKKAQASNKSKVAPKKAPVKTAKLTTFIKPNPDTVSLLKGYYKDLAETFRIMFDNAEKKNKQLTEPVLQAKFDKITDGWAVKVDTMQGNANIIKFSFNLPKSKKADFKKVSTKKK